MTPPTNRAHGVQGVAGSNPAVPTSSSNEFDPDVVEDWKWVKPKSPGTPVWSHDGIICTGESYKNAVTLTFAKGAFLKDPGRLFNSSLDGNVRRAIDIHEGEKADAYAASRSGRRGRYGKNVEWMEKVSDEQYRR